MLKTIAFAIAVLIGGVLIYAANKPDTFSVQRSIAVQAPPEKIFPLIHDFKQWPNWSPYEGKDPAMKRSYGPVTAGVGATYAWAGNKDVGRGDMKISGATPPTALTLQLHFIEPFEGHNQVDFKIDPEGGQSKLSWIMNGPAPFPTKLMSMFIDMDKMIGKDFEVGLANIKALAEKP